MTDENNFLLRDDLSEHVARLTLNRAERRNALTVSMLDALLAEIDAISSEKNRQVAIIRGAGRSFCAGADLSTLGSNSADLGVHPVWDAIERAPFPIIAAVQGHAITGGLLLAAACDFIIAAEGTIFQDTHAHLGLIPTGGEAQRLPRRMGLYFAREMMLTSRRVSADELYDRGLITKVVAADELDNASEAFAETFAGRDRGSIATIKRMINRGSVMPYAAALHEDFIDSDWGRANSKYQFDRDSLASSQSKARKE